MGGKSWLAKTGMLVGGSFYVGARAIANTSIGMELDVMRAPKILIMSYPEVWAGMIG